MVPCREERSSGTRCTSSMIAPSGYWDRKARGSSDAKARTSGASRLT